MRKKQFTAIVPPLTEKTKAYVQSSILCMDCGDELGWCDYCEKAFCRIGHEEPIYCCAGPHHFHARCYPKRDKKED